MQLDPEILEAIYTNKGEDLKNLSKQQDVLLVFLRHFGCTFCREALSDVKLGLERFEKEGLKVVMVHMVEEELAADYLTEYKLDHISRISDPDLSLYEYFGLHKGGFFQIYGLKIWWRALAGGVIKKYGKPQIDDKRLGDVEQMPGIFVLRDCQIINQFIHKSAADKPNYMEIVKSIPQAPSTTTKDL